MNYIEDLIDKLKLILVLNKTLEISFLPIFYLSFSEH